MLKIDAYLMAWMLRILERIRPACGLRMLLMSTLDILNGVSQLHAGIIHMCSAIFETNSTVLL